MVARRAGGGGDARAAVGQLTPPEVGPCSSAAGGKINCGRMPAERSARAFAAAGRAREKERERKKTLERHRPRGTRLRT